MEQVLTHPYTRYPVYDEEFDNVLGVLHVRRLFVALQNGAGTAPDLRSLIYPAHLVPETKRLGHLLAEIRRQKSHMAIVIDEYGSMEGIVTLEDLLEEIVGEIEDEFDLPDETVERIDDNTIRIDGTFPIDDFNEQFDCRLPGEDYHTVAGFVFGLLGRAAEPGDEVEDDGLTFRVDSVEGQRIDRLTVTFKPWHRRNEGGTDEDGTAVER
jgi:putative hemolysin